MRAPRVSVAGLMGMVLVASLGFAALRDESGVGAELAIWLTCGALALTIVGVACAAPSERAWWLGAALSGWGYMLLALTSHGRWVDLPTIDVVRIVSERLGATLDYSTDSSVVDNFRNPIVESPDLQVFHCLWSLAMAAIGGTLARALFAVSPARPDAESPCESRPPRRWPGRPVWAGLAGLVLVAGLTWAGLRSAPRLTVATLSLLTSALWGASALGAALGRSRCRARWLGALLFGAGSIIMTMGFDRLRHETYYQVPIAVDQLLGALRPRLMPAVREIPARSAVEELANRRLRRAMTRPMALHYPEGTRLEDILEDMKAATREGPNSRGIPICVDPAVISRSEKGGRRTAAPLDREGVPLETALRLLLDQCELDFAIWDGMLVITESFDQVVLAQDPFLQAGHALLALLAAGLGALVAPLVCDWHSKPHRGGAIGRSAGPDPPS